MHNFDFSPIYRSTIGFDRLAGMLDKGLSTNNSKQTYPPYNITSSGDGEYGITLAVAGFSAKELDLQVEGGTLTVSGKKHHDNTSTNYLYQGIAFRAFTKKFEIAEHVRVSGAELGDGLLSVTLVREIPDALKPKKINIEAAHNSKKGKNNSH